MKTTTILGAVMATAMFATLTGCAADPATGHEGDEAAESEIQGDVLFANATLDVDTYPAGGDPACADQFVGTKDPYCGYPFELGQTRLGWATKPYRLNRDTPAKVDGFSSLAGKVTALSAKPIVEGIGGKSTKARAHRLVAEAVPAKLAAPACKDWSTYFAKEADGSFLPRIEAIRTKLLPELVLESGSDIGDDGLSLVTICGVSVPVYQQTTSLTWDGSAFAGAMPTPVGKDGHLFGAYVHGSYQIDWIAEGSASMPLPNAPAGFALQLSHRVGK